ncbi:hypothetical protein ATK30_8075 [Amycolatopsis echigonensis]|uniref:PknH-like protein n=1 Tax=Amycolatopsis echigonensis TaxID=2576905 RepID=A0A2N3WTB9_9PSEU|nr:hypothetical protein [Amycolatopsis niigatensis]PKV97106.1 hypothetical protein ATK30_8075 [Amycolatopsis niigatensis]
MRRRQVPAVAVLVGLGALAGLAGCGNRPNNLETYYDDPVPVPGTSAPVSPPVSRAVDPPAVSSAAAPDPQRASAALLADADVAEEGVKPGSGRVSGCLTGLAAGERKSVSWVYPSGSALTHEVTAYPDRSGEDIVSGAHCAGAEVPLPPQPGIAVQRAWCEGSTCAVLVAKGNLVSALSVAASTPARAQDAAMRLLPKMANKLTAQP